MLKRVAGMFCLIVILLAGTAVVQAQPPPSVADFTIVGPPVVVSGEPFQIDVIEVDNIRRPIAPGYPSTVFLSAWNFSTNPPTPIPISPTSFEASGNGDDLLNNVTLTAPPRTRVRIKAQGYGVGPSGRNSPAILVVGPGDRGDRAEAFGLSAPFFANPNQPFPVYITPLQPRPDVEVGNVAPFSGMVNLRADIGAISPTSVNIDVPSGGSARVLVTLDAVTPNNRIHAEAAGPGGGPTPKYTVEFRNHDTEQLNRFLMVLRANLTAMAESVFVRLPGVADSFWQSTIWPFRVEGFRGWQMLTFIPGAGINGQGVQFHATLVSSAAPLSALPGDSILWNPDFVINTANWELVSGAFPPGLDGTYWFRYLSLSPGGNPGLRTSFVNNSPQLDRALTFVDVDGDTTVDVLSNYGIKGLLWNNQIWRVGQDTDAIFHVLSDFIIPPPFEGEVQLHTIYVPSSYPRPMLPDAEAWNEAFIVAPETDFADVTGDPLPPDFNGSYWTYIEVVAAPGGDGPEVLRGWSNQINTTGQDMAENILRMDEVSVEPGGSGVLTVVLRHDRPVAGLQFRIEPQHWDEQNHFHAGEATFQGVINDLEHLGFTVTAATGGNGVTTVLLFSTTGAVLPPGEQTLMELVYRVDGNAPFGDWIMMVMSDALLSDPDSRPIYPATWHGSIHVGRRGDLNATGDINILDLIQEIKYVLGALPEPFGFRRFLADPNGDGAINILDIVWMINAILHGGPAKVLADGPTSPVTVSLDDLQTLISGQLAIPVTMSADGVVAGMQAAFTFDPSQLEPGLPQLVGRAEGMMLQSHVTAGRLQVLIYSPTGQAIPAGHGTTLLVPVTVLSGPEADPTLALSQVLLANRQAQAIPVGLGTSTVKVQPLPTAFALKPNRPNPFNPATAIAYDVPRTAHIMLAVYNLLGQEVVRLVDEPKTPGRYIVTWDGRNGQGMNVASGVYLYRLTTSAGFSQTRRMTLVK